MGMKGKGVEGQGMNGQLSPQDTMELGVLSILKGGCYQGHVSESAGAPVTPGLQGPASRPGKGPWELTHGGISVKFPDCLLVPPPLL